MPKLKVSGLKTYYFTEYGIVRAVDGINLDLPDGQSVGIVGESACGKSTLGATIMQSIQLPGKVVEGSISLGDYADITKMSRSEFDTKVRWKRIAMVFQGAMNALDPVYTVESQLQEILKEHNYQGKIDDKVAESLQQVGLDLSVARRYPHELSGGMKQRVVIAMALLLNPDVLVADEPTTALDMLNQSQIINLLKKLQKEKGITIVLITHDLALVSQITDKIGIMYAGQLVEFSSTKDIYKNPRHPYTQALIEAIPRLKTKDKKIHFINGTPPSLLHPPQGCRFRDRCTFAMELCKRDPPEFRTETGYVRCWLYDSSAEKPPTLKSVGC
ncbi:MAG: ABC transporter ATP-binding protein [Thermoproteota archaeon]|nr:ABC transporter ATP-binding protein [Thermoproteota archaeon]